MPQSLIYLIFSIFYTFAKNKHKELKKAICRILLTAKEEAHSFQIQFMGFRSFWYNEKLPNMIRTLVPESRIQEQSKITTPFRAGQLENSDLFILSDLEHISKDVVGLLKGRAPNYI